MAKDASLQSTSSAPPKTEPNELKQRLASVQDQLRAVEDQVRADAESLQKLRQMLDVSYLEEITGLIADLEHRVAEVARDAERARERADEAEAMLKEEQERLEKLWDVYKVQEDELEELRGNKSQLERDIEQSKDEIRELSSTVEAERRALRQAQEENGSLRQKLADAEAQAEDLKAYAELDTKVAELEGKLNEERERLAKLYAVFEETQAERDDHAASLKQWEAWFTANKSHFKGVGKAFNEAPGE